MTVGRVELTALQPQDVRTGRQALRRQLTLWDCTQVDDGLLVFSELVTNAVKHAGGATRVDIIHESQVLRFEVHDRTHDVPTLTPPSGGFGLSIIGQLSHSWGWDQEANGKVVWSDVSCCPDP